MPSYRFFPPADRRQDEIWDYSDKTWSKAQAEKYIRNLHKHLQALADRKKQWRNLPNSLIVPPDLNIKIYFSQYERHYVFFRELSEDSIGIMSILHESMDIPVRLGNDLEKIRNNKKR
ncbi:MAG: type II toxin-antitoxin system RelE/ParE family toxin [Methylococcaceae bacterium]|nr:type II toxin-antitoxin system RelE/ParE family toxin [Methylococcaceae bacterium]